MITKRLHHVAYRCNDAQQTVDFYTKVMGMKYAMAISEDRVPSTKEPDPYMHVFFAIGDGSFLAFFELPNSPPMGKDPNTPEWVQHLALRVESVDALIETKERIESFGIDVIGPIDHSIFKSIYFFDPNGHRLELAADTVDPAELDELAGKAESMLEEWNRTHSTVRQAEWLHKKEFDTT
jgi:catechol 2,3-dioxygenase-like lactoylglutathione lyase family enzyme